MATAITGDPLIDARNVPNGALGYIYFYFSDGSSQSGMYVTKTEFKDQKNKTTLGALGTAAKLHKATSVEGTFSIEGYDVTDVWPKLQQQFRSEGKDEYFNITVVEWDPTTDLGKKITNYYYCNIDEAMISSQDVDDAVKKTSFAGTYDDFEIVQGYNILNGLDKAKDLAEIVAA